jgi:HEPN domain-containing protein
MRRDPTNPRTWLLRARSNLRRAALGPQHPEVFLEDLCWDAQQAAEKALKALCIHRGIAFPKTHSLEMLSEHDSIFACGAGDLSMSEQRTTEERREL